MKDLSADKLLPRWFLTLGDISYQTINPDFITFQFLNPLTVLTRIFKRPITYSVPLFIQGIPESMTWSPADLARHRGQKWIVPMSVIFPPTDNRSVYFAVKPKSDLDHFGLYYGKKLL